MLLKQMMANDQKNCYEAISKDEFLQNLERDFYSYRERMDIEDFIQLEEIFSEYMARVTRLAYLQGMKDFNELCLVLKENTNDIMKNCLDS